MIKETIVVEGKDDIANVKRAVDCEMICTNGLSFGKDLIEKLKKNKWPYGDNNFDRSRLCWQKNQS